MAYAWSVLCTRNEVVQAQSDTRIIDVIYGINPRLLGKGPRWSNVIIHKGKPEFMYETLRKR